MAEIDVSGAPCCGGSGAICSAKRVGNTIVVSGTVAVNEAGDVIGPGDLFLQTRACIQRIRAALQQLEAELSDVVRTRAFVTDIARFEEFARAHREAFEGIDPAATCVEVARLIRPEFLVEVEVDAMVTK